MGGEGVPFNDTADTFYSGHQLTMGGEGVHLKDTPHTFYSGHQLTMGGEGFPLKGMVVRVPKGTAGGFFTVDNNYGW